VLAVALLGHADLPALRGALNGVSAAAAGLMIATGLRLLKPYRRDLRALLVAGLAFVGLALVKLPLLMVLAVLAPASLAAVFLLGARRS